MLLNPYCLYVQFREPPQGLLNIGFRAKRVQCVIIIKFRCPDWQGEEIRFPEWHSLTHMYFPPDSALTSPSTLSVWTATWKNFKLYKTLWGMTSPSRGTAGQKHMGHRRGDKVIFCADHLHQGVGERRRVQLGVVRKFREEMGSLLPSKWMTLEKRVMLHTGGGIRKMLVKLLVS